MSTSTVYHCPHCGHNVRTYKRKLNSGMARWLVALYKLELEEVEPIHTDKVLASMGAGCKARDAALLRHWGLIAPDFGGGKGCWKTTSAGRQFIGGSPLPVYAVLQNNDLKSFDGPLVTIRKCLGSHFDIDELLDGIRPDMTKNQTELLEAAHG